MTTFFGFAIADSMFQDSDLALYRHAISAERVKQEIAEHADSFVSAANPSHVATIDAAKERYGIVVPVSEVAQIVSLKPGDTLIVMSVRGLPRLDATRHEYTADEISSAKFSFALYDVAEYPFYIGHDDDDEALSIALHHDAEGA